MYMDLLIPELFSYFQDIYISQGYIQNFERNLKNSICIKVNNFATPVKF